MKSHSLRHLAALLLTACSVGGIDDGPNRERGSVEPAAPLPDWQAPADQPVDQYLVGDWDGDGVDELAVRRGHCVQMDGDGDGEVDREQCYGNGAAEDEYLVGDWDGDGVDELAVRRGHCVLMDHDGAGGHDREQCYGNGAAEDGYLVGDWDGDGTDELAVRRGQCVVMDYDGDGVPEREQCYGLGAAEDQYLVGDWDGDGTGELAVRRGHCVLMDYDGAGGHDREQCYGNGAAEDEYLVGDWDGDGVDELAVRRDDCVFADFDGDGDNELKLCLGKASAGGGDNEPPPQQEPPSKKGPVATIAGKRFTVFYQPGGDALDIYADPKLGLPEGPNLVHVFAHSGSSKAVSEGLAKKIHSARGDFLYAPAFDLHEHQGWLTASKAELAAWAREFRDDAIAAGADLFAFNEAPTATGESEQMRQQMARLLGYLAEPNEDGVSLRGVFFMTHKPSMPGSWTNPADGFWKAVDDTCDAVVAEHYHGVGYVCGQSLDELSSHLFAMREWLSQSGVPAKVSIANKKFTVLHSSRYAPGSSGWQGADSTKVSLARFQRDLSRLALATRTTPGGFNRISFAPVYPAHTVNGVHQRIALLSRWHYGKGGDGLELSCVKGFPGNCQCD